MKPSCIEPTPITTPYTNYERDIATVQTCLHTIFSEHMRISESLRGLAPQLNTFETTYKTWKAQADALEGPLNLAWEKVAESMKGLCSCCDYQKSICVVDTMTPLMLDLLRAQQEHAELLECLDITHAHRNAVELYKTMVKECESIVSSKKSDLLPAQFQSIKKAIALQQSVINDKSENCKKAITDIHRSLCEFILYCAKQCQSTVDVQNDINHLLTSLQPVPLASLAALRLDSEQMQQSVRSFLDNCTSISLETPEQFRQGQMGALLWYSSNLGDVIQALTKVKQGIKKVLSMLQTRIHELAVTPQKINTKLDFKSLSEEAAFYNACVQEIERRIDAQREQLYKKPFSTQLHAGINYALQRESSCHDLGLLIWMFTELSTNPTWIQYPELLNKLLAITASPPKRSLDDLRDLGSGILMLNQLSPVKGPLERLYTIRSTCLTATIAKAASKILQNGVESEIEALEQLFERVPLTEAFTAHEPLTQLPEGLKETISKLVISRFFFKDQTALPELDLALYTLREHPSYKPCFDKTLQDDPLFARDIALYKQFSDWDSEQARPVLSRLYIIFGELAKYRHQATNRHHSVHRFLRYAAAQQAAAEITLLSHLETTSSSSKSRIEALLPRAKTKLYTIHAPDNFPDYFKDPIQPCSIKIENHVLTVDNKEITQQVIPQVLYNLLLSLLYGNLHPSLRAQKENSLHVLLNSVDSQAMLTSLRSSSHMAENYIELLLFRHLVTHKRQITQQENELTTALLTHCFSSQEILDMWMDICGPCFVLSALLTTIEAQSAINGTTSERFLERFSRTHIGWGYNAFTKTVGAYRALNTPDAFATYYNQAKLEVEKKIPPNSSSLVSQLIYTAIPKCMKELEQFI